MRRSGCSGRSMAAISPGLASVVLNEHAGGCNRVKVSGATGVVTSRGLKQAAYACPELA